MAFKRAKVAMLATKVKGPIFLVGDWNKLYSGNEYRISSLSLDTLVLDESFQHLYIISHKREIGVDDWFITNQAPQQCIEIREGDYPYRIKNSCNGELQWHSKHWHGLIIASTNPSLGLPQPSEGFIQKFIEKWNKDEKIEEVDVEYEIDKYDIRNQYQDCPSGKYWMDEPIPPSPDNLYSNASHYIPKVNPKDNTVTIKSIKNSWTREEVITLIKTFGRDFDLYVDTVQYKEINQWLTKNL
jgi:hypothetical protein